MTAVLTSMFAMILMMFYEPFLSIHYVTHFGIDEIYVGYYFGIGCFALAFGSPIVGYLCDIVDRRILNSLAFFLVGIALFVFGPSELLGFKDSFALTLTGMGILGFSIAFVFVP